VTEPTVLSIDLPDDVHSASPVPLAGAHRAHRLREGLLVRTDLAAPLLAKEFMRQLPRSSE